MPLKTRSLGIPRWAVAETNSTESCAPIQERCKSSSSKHQYKPIWFHLLHLLSHAEKALWMSNSIRSFIWAKGKEVPSGEAPLEKNYLQNMNLQLQLQEKYAMALGQEIKWSETSQLRKEDAEQERSAISGKKQQTGRRHSLLLMAQKTRDTQLWNKLWKRAVKRKKSFSTKLLGETQCYGMLQRFKSKQIEEN